jgi:hypothetical protein
MTRSLAAHVWGFYVEPEWCSERLFEVEEFVNDVWDPACGLGRIAKAALQAKLRVVATDIIQRDSCKYFKGDALDFLQAPRSYSNNIVCNPPFHLAEEFARHALKLTCGKVAMIWSTRRLNAAHWLADTPLARIYLLTPRPSMPPGDVILRGEKAGGGTQDFAWLVWEHSHHGGPPVIHWLHRDGS